MLLIVIYIYIDKVFHINEMVNMKTWYLFLKVSYLVKALQILNPQYYFSFFSSFVKIPYCCALNNVSFDSCLGHFVHFLFILKSWRRILSGIKRIYCRDRDIIVTSTFLSFMNYLYKMPHNSMPKQYLWPLLVTIYIHNLHICISKSVITMTGKIYFS